MMHGFRSWWWRVLTACLVGVTGLAAPAAQGAPNRVRDVAQLPLLGAPEIPDAAVEGSGWLILNPVSRRGYQVFERTWETVIQSFDLDTLAPRSRARVAGVPVVTGANGTVGAGGTSDSGEIVHAVDPAARRLYLPLSMNHNVFPAGYPGPHPRRMLSHVLVLDENMFDLDPARAFAAFGLAGAEQRLLDYPLMGMTVSRHHAAPAEPGRLLALFASPYPLSNAPFVATPIPGLYDHTLAQWDPSDIPCCGPAPTASVPGVASPPPVPLPTDWQQVLAPCAAAPMSSTATASLLVRKNFQWGILAKADAIYTGCQSAPQVGAMVRVALDPATGAPRPLGQAAVSFGWPIFDVLTDEGGGQLLARSPSAVGTLWWAFDTAASRFTGVFAVPDKGQPSTAGIDPATGRFYGLTRDGLLVTDARVVPIPAPTTVRPDLGAASHWRIAVDPVTRRLFVRRGSRQGEPAPEPFYRVLEDRIPLPG